MSTAPTTTAPPGAPSGSPPRRDPARRSRRYGRDDVAAYLFLLPFILMFLVFLLYPVVQAVVMSFFDWDLLTQSATDFGLDNYERMLGGQDLTWSLTNLLGWRTVVLALVAVVVLAARRGRMTTRAAVVVGASLLVVWVLLGIHPGPEGQWNDPRFWQAFKHTVEFTVWSTPLLVALGLVMAMAVNRPTRLAGVYRTAFFLPYVLPVSVVTLIWIYLLNPDRGLVAWLTESLGLGVVDYLNNPSTALWAVIVTTTWWVVGFNLVLFLAGLQDIDPSLYEAASLDGAGRWATFVNITLPGLRRVTVLVLVAQVIASFQIFGQVYLMTGGGPGTASLVLIQHIYETGIRDASLGYASAMSLMLLAIMLVVSLAQIRLLEEKDDR
jgi:multiple sugar transport system permease protein